MRNNHRKCSYYNFFFFFCLTFISYNVNYQKYIEHFEFVICLF